jgi:GT2 family glycosyltransferase
LIKDAPIESADSAPVVDVWCSVVAFHTPREEIERLAVTLARVPAQIALTIVDNSIENARALPAVLDLPSSLPVNVLRPGQNLGYGRAHNLAIEQSTGRCRYHLVLNSDILFEPEVITELMAFMDDRPTAGLAMPMVRYPDGRVQHLCRLLPDPVVLIGRRFFGRMAWTQMRNRQYELHDWTYDQVASFPFLSGCFMFMRRTVLDRVVGFDPRYFLYAEDLDLSRRIHAVAETLFYPNVEIVHEYRSLTRRSLRQWIYGITSLSQYFSKWGWFVDRDRDMINAKTVAALASRNI